MYRPHFLEIVGKDDDGLRLTLQDPEQPSHFRSPDLMSFARLIDEIPARDLVKLLILGHLHRSHDRLAVDFDQSRFLHSIVERLLARLQLDFLLVNGERRQIENVLRHSQGVGPNAFEELA